MIAVSIFVQAVIGHALVVQELMIITVFHALQMIIEPLMEIAVYVQKDILTTEVINLAKHVIFHVQHAQEIFQIIVYRVLIQIIEFLQIIDAVVKMDFMKTV